MTRRSSVLITACVGGIDPPKEKHESPGNRRGAVSAGLRWHRRGSDSARLYGIEALRRHESRNRHTVGLPCGVYHSTGEADAVIFAQSYDPFRRAYVDGKEVFNNQVNLAIQGVFVRAGEHELIYEYRPTKLYWGLGASAATFLLCPFILVRDRTGRGARRTGPGES